MALPWGAAEAEPARPQAAYQKKRGGGLRAARDELLSNHPPAPSGSNPKPRIPTHMCIHFSSDSSYATETASAADQKAWSLVAKMPNGSEQRFSAGVVRREDGRLVVSLRNHAPQHADVGVVQWLGSDDPEEASADLDHAVAFAERVVTEYQKPAGPEELLVELFGGRPAFFVRADEAYPGFAPLPVEDQQPTPDGFGAAA